VIAPCAVEWLAEASPKLHSTTPSGASGVSSSPIRRAMPIENAAPTALGRWLAMVLVCGGMASRFDPSTLCRPPEIGSSAEAANESSMSHAGFSPGTRPAQSERSVAVVEKAMSSVRSASASAALPSCPDDPMV
jgi:hypothetical protein